LRHLPSQAAQGPKLRSSTRNFVSDDKHINKQLNSYRMGAASFQRFTSVPVIGRNGATGDQLAAASFLNRM
jgi:hypothetical protein